MIRTSFCASALALSLAPATLASTGGDDWYADYDKAAAAAQEQGKDLLVDFTGSDWCGWCIKLDEEVFGHDEFLNAAKENYVLVALDFPSSEEVKAKVPNPERNEELKNAHGVAGFPTVLLMTADGETFAKTGYRAGGPEAYVEHMAELRKNREELFATKELADQFAELEPGAEKWKKWDEIVEMYGSFDDSKPFGKALESAVVWGFERDEDNSMGKRLTAAVALLKNGAMVDEAFDAISELDPNNEAGHLETATEAVLARVRDDESARAAIEALRALNKTTYKDESKQFMFNARAAMWADGPLDDSELAVELAKKALEVGSDDERNAELVQNLERIVG